MNAPDQITITFAGKQYTGRRLSTDQILAIRPVRDDAGLMLDVLETFARYAFGEAGFVEHLLARARGEQTVEGFIKLMVKFMEASAEDGTADTAPAPEIPATFRGGLDVAAPPLGSRAV